MVLLVAAVLRLELLTVRSLWHDEAFSLAVARKPVVYILQNLGKVDPHPFGYYVVLRGALFLWGDRYEVGRALSAMLGLGAVVLTWLLGRNIFSRAVGVVGAGLVALNPFQIFAANEIRMYPLATCLALLSTWAAWRAARSEGTSLWVLYGLTLAAMAYTSYYLVLVAAGQFLWLIGRRQGKGVAWAATTAALLFLPWLPQVPREVLPIVGARGSYSVGHALELFATHAYGGYLFGTTSYLASGGFDPFRHGPLLLPFIFLAGLGLLFFRRSEPAAAGLIFAVWGVGYLGTVVASAGLGHPAAYPRQVVFLQPFLALLVAGGVVGAGRFSRSKLARCLVPGLAVVALLGYLVPAVNNLQGNPQYQAYRYDRAVKHVRKLYRPGDVLIFYQGGAQRVFREYGFDPDGVQVAVDPDFERWSREGMRPILEKAAQGVASSRGRVWLVLVGPYPPDSPLDLIQAMERFGYRRVVRQNFAGIDVVLLTRPYRPDS